MEGGRGRIGGIEGEEELKIGGGGGGRGREMGKKVGWGQGQYNDVQYRKESMEYLPTWLVGRIEVTLVEGECLCLGPGWVKHLAG